LFDWAVASRSGAHPAVLESVAAGRRHILTHNQLEAGKQPELAYYLCAGPPGTSDEDLIRVAGARWAIEECFQTTKTEVGARPVPGPPLRRLVPPHHARHSGSRLPLGHRRERPKRPGSGLIPLALGEIRRLLANLTRIPNRARMWA
jgi:hypothetical protein